MGRLVEETTIIQNRYNRNARFYDIMETLIEKWHYSKWRKKYFSPLKGKILEVGIGTGKNIEYINADAKVTGIDFSEKMLEKAYQKLARSKRKNINLKQMNVEKLYFDDNSFDYVMTSSVFCSVPDPVKGLKEIKRVLKSKGKLIMVEHVLSNNRSIAFFENLFNPLVRFFTGVNINRNTKQNIINSSLKITNEENLGLVDVFKLFVAVK